MKVIILNAFSLNMISTSKVDISVREVPLERVRRYIADKEVESHVGHADTAAVFSALLGVSIPCIRDTVTLDTDGKDGAIVGQYAGPRLQEGAKTLPEGATIKWFMVRLQPVYGY